MLKQILSISLFLMLCFTSIGQNIISSNSKVTFKIGNMGFKSVKGSFTGLNGDLTFSADNLQASNFDVCIDAATINTENQKRDEHLKNEDFFDVEKYPTICFTSSAIVKTNTGYETTGILKMHGVTKTVKIPFTYSNNTFTGKINVNRADYGIGPNGGFMVGKNVEIQIIAKVN